ncbi:hypothetical protein ACWD4G_14525 [Streptomyces sp. NPDC002643]
MNETYIRIAFTGDENPAGGISLEDDTLEDLAGLDITDSPTCHPICG